MKVQDPTPRKTLSCQDLDELKTLYQRMEEILGGFNEGLSVENRRRLIHLDRGNHLFVRDIAETMRQKPTLCPGYLNAEEIIDKYQYYRQLEEVLLIHQHAQENLRDMKVLLGDTCYREGLSVYKAVRDAKDNNVPGAKVFYNQLSKRFTGQGNANPGGSNAEGAEQTREASDTDPMEIPLDSSVARSDGSETQAA